MIDIFLVLEQMEDGEFKEKVSYMSSNKYDCKNYINEQKDKFNYNDFRILYFEMDLRLIDIYRY